MHTRINNMKKCRKCGEHKPLKEYFHVQGYHSNCTKCRTPDQKISQPSTCKECGRSYIKTQPAQKYCSRECKLKTERIKARQKYSSAYAREYYRKNKNT